MKYWLWTICTLRRPFLPSAWKMCWTNGVQFIHYKEKDVADSIDNIFRITLHLKENLHWESRQRVRSLIIAVCVCDLLSLPLLSCQNKMTRKKIIKEANHNSPFITISFSYITSLFNRIYGNLWTKGLKGDLSYKSPSIWKLGICRLALSKWDKCISF